MSLAVIVCDESQMGYIVIPMSEHIIYFFSNTLLRLNRESDTSLLVNITAAPRLVW